MFLSCQRCFNVDAISKYQKIKGVIDMNIKELIKEDVRFVVGGGMSWSDTRRAMTSNDAYNGINHGCVTRSFSATSSVGNALACASSYDPVRKYEVSM